MGTFGIWHILILAVVVLVLFGGKGKISDLMGDFGKGVNSFKKGLGEGAKEDPKVINGASDFMVAALGEAGRHARSAVSAASLPFGVAVEIEGIFEIR